MKLQNRNMPCFFENVLTKEQWQKKKPEILKSFLEEEYGNLPKKLPYGIRTETQWVNFAGKAKWESVFFDFEENGKSHTVRTELILPVGKENIPVFLLINFGGEVPHKYLPAEEIIDNGFGVFAFNYENVTKDDNDFTNGLSGLFCNGERENNSYGKITLWAYMALICTDYLCSRQEIDKNNIAVIGHSRLGKTALLASALDSRFKLTCSNDSGCCGASVSRGKTKDNESLSDITRVFPQWFSKSFLKYVDNENALPFDQHMLLSLIAPRHLMVGMAKEDVWADNEGQLLACHLSSYVWELYGEKGLISEEDTDGEFLFDKGKITVYQRNGAHYLSRDDWRMYMKKFKEIIDGEKNGKES